MRQFWFPFILPHERNELANPPNVEKIRAYVEAESVGLRARHIVREEIIDILSAPRLYWNRVVVVKGEKNRVCYVPTPQLRAMLIKVARALRNCVSKVPPHTFFPATAFRIRDSIIQNGWYHFGRKSSLVLDLKDAFASIKTRHVYLCLKRMKMSKKLAWLLSKLVTFNGRLRQGSPISPMVFNILLKEFDLAIVKAVGSKIVHSATLTRCGKGWRLEAPYKTPCRVIYTRYGDDLCFSSMRQRFPKTVEKRIQSVIRKFGFKLNRKRKEGKFGYLELPGIRIVRGRMQPDHDIIKRYAKAVAEDAPKDVIQGYIAFFKQFPRSGRKKAMRIAESLVRQMRQTP